MISKKKKDNVPPPSDIDFAALAKEHGYVKARQLLKQVTIKSQQNKIKVVETELNNSRQPLRLKEALRMGSTYGEYHSGNILNKLLCTNQDILLSETSASMILDKHLNEVHKPEAVLKVLENRLPVEGAVDERLIPDVALRQSMADETQLLIPNRDIDCLPVGLGDTLALQLSYVRKISCTRNNMTTVINQEIPQLSAYHLRYLREVNMSYNKIVRLPSDLGVWKNLEVLNLCQNMLSKLPESIGQLKNLKHFDLSGNSFATLPDVFSLLDSLERVNLSDNLFSLFPNALIRLKNLKYFNLSKNSLQHLAILPPLLKPQDMWLTTIDKRTGRDLFVNILTKERMKKIEFYNGEGINKAQDLHVFQYEGSKSYRRRKMWLSVNQINEWEPDNDVSTGLLFYRNNVSGMTSWEMPPSLDTMGLITTLEELSIKNNSIKVLPSSFTQMIHLRKVVLIKNRIGFLPEDIGALTLLEHLDLSSNELKIVPTSICSCANLKEIIINDNHLLRLPEDLGELPKLRKLDVSVNHLKSVPFSLGNCTTLEVFLATENPMADPPIEEFGKGLDSLKWYLRNRYMIEKRGMPPLMEFHTIGICDEVTILKPEFIEIVRQMIRASVKDGLLNLQLLGLREVPVDVLKMPDLKKLKLDFNDKLGFKLGFAPSFKNLVMLSLRSCKMPTMPDNVYIMEKLTSLNLEENRFQTLPPSFTEIVTLTKLDISKNKLYGLPLGFHNLVNLKYLNLESNNIEVIPNRIGRMKQLRTLILSKNRIVDFPESVCDLSGLKVLNIEKNKLQFIPNRICELSLSELRIGHNRIEQLPDNMFSGPLGTTVKIFSCCENNIMEMPSSLVNIDPEALLEGDYNPLVSPPSYLLSDGLTIVQNYLKIRLVRRIKFEELMSDEDFSVVTSAISPVAYEVLDGGTGFLTPDDLAEFDTAVDELLNGEFFRCPANTEEIVGAVTKLREFRETELYLTILNTFLSVLEKIASSKDKRFSEAVLHTRKRPWGRNGEDCNVWILSLHALLRETPPNPFHPQGRPSVFDMIAQALPRIAFPFTMDLLKDSIRLYNSPYGKIADTEEVTFPNCDCVDEKRNKAIRHNPCVKPAVILVKSVYVEEEAVRRAIEEDEYLLKFEEVEEEILIWLVTDEGKATQEKEIKKRKEILREEIKLREEMVLSQQLKVKKANDKIKILKKRKKDFENGDPFEAHGFNNMGEAIKALQTEEDNCQKITDRVGILQDTIKDLRTKVNQEQIVFLNKTQEDIIQKYCYLAHASTVNKFRRHAAKNNLKRHWDGDDGIVFEKWKRDNVYLGNTDEMDEWLDVTTGGISKPLKKTHSQNSMNSDTSRTGKPAVKEEEKTEYDFNDTLNMIRFKLNLYETYKRNKTLFGSIANQMGI